MMKKAKKDIDVERAFIALNSLIEDSYLMRCEAEVKLDVIDPVFYAVQASDKTVRSRRVLDQLIEYRSYLHRLIGTHDHNISVYRKRLEQISQ